VGRMTTEREDAHDEADGDDERQRMTERQAPSNWNVPNALTTLRIVMVPVFAWALLMDDGNSTGWRWVAYGLFAAAMITDKIDGDLARKYDLVTNFGKIADPIADKALTGMAFVGLSIIGELWWWVTIVVLIREWGITLMRFWLIRRGVVMPASQGGKLKTTAQTLALGLLIMPLRMLEGAWEPVGLVLWWIAVAAMAGAVALTVWTGVVYVRDTIAAQRRTVTS
jgi:CDP-diacylglycerol---glycerol-3-phosphate 3-phosphatidyltransferase